VTDDQLRAVAESGELQPDDLVWCEGLPEWVPASRVEGLFPNPTPPPKRPWKHGRTWDDEERPERPWDRGRTRDDDDRPRRQNRLKREEWEEPFGTWVMTFLLIAALFFPGLGVALALAHRKSRDKTKRAQLAVLLSVSIFSIAAYVVSQLN
jgi:hypothetical protein